jgi:hypothetical protein
MCVYIYIYTLGDGYISIPQYAFMVWCAVNWRFGLSGVRVPARAGNLSLGHRVQTGSVDHPGSYPVDTMGYFPGSKTAGA